MLERSCRHDRRHIAAETDDQRHEGLAGQAHPTHETVHDEGRARHVARVLQHRQEQEQEADHRDEGGDDLDAAADALRQQHRQPLGRTEAGEHRGHAIDQQRPGELVEEVDEGAADADGEQKHQIHHQQEDRHAQCPIEHDTVDAVGEVATGAAAHRDRGRGDAVGKPVARVRHHDVDVVAELAREPLRLGRGVGARGA